MEQNSPVKFWPEVLAKSTVNIASHIMDVSQLPYQLPNRHPLGDSYQPPQGRPPPPGATPSYQATHPLGATPSYQAARPLGATSQADFNHPLEGVGFSLSPNLKLDTELEYIAAAVNSVLAKIEEMDWSVFEYNFTLERSVLINELLEDQNEDELIDNQSEDVPEGATEL